MKIRLNKKTLAALPIQLRPMVEEWRARWGKSAIAVNYRDKFYIEEDAKYTAFSADLSDVKTVRAGGEWNGVSLLVPGSDCPLPIGCTVLVTGLFQGEPWLTIYHNPAGDRNFISWQLKQIAPVEKRALPVAVST